MTELEKTTDISTPYYASVDDLRKAAKCVFLATEEDVAKIWLTNSTVQQI